MTRRRLSVSLVVVVLLGGCSPAEAPDTSFETAMAAIDLEELDSTMRESSSSSETAMAAIDVESTRQEAEQGDADAQFRLALLYLAGHGVPQDGVEALKWANLLTSRSTGDEREGHAAFLDTIAESMTPAQIAEAQQLAREWQAAFDARQE
jgi:hypothetical protein